ncbi:MAG: hypothetical protein LBV12_03455 [Puniceicoccales bacterium]|jgi:hypothetical protein|nr:hypothetical protein [Puniceicoccales bacterium]
MKKFEIKMLIILALFLVSNSWQIVGADEATSTVQMANDNKDSNLDKEKAILRQMITGFNCIEFKYEIEFSEKEDNWKKSSEGEFAWDRQSGNFRWITWAADSKNKDVTWIFENTCRKNEKISIQYKNEKKLSGDWTLPSKNDINLKNMHVSVERPSRFPLFCQYIPNLGYPLFHGDENLTDLLKQNFPDKSVQIKKEFHGERGLLNVIVLYADNTFSQEFVFDLKNRVFKKQVNSRYFKGALWDRTTSIADEYVEINGWKFPLRITHTATDKDGLLVRSTRYSILKESLKINEPISETKFIARVPDEATVNDRIKGLEYEGININSPTEEIVVNELDRVFEQANLSK